MTGALARETRTIPIVFAGESDPIGSGFAANLAHPGGNITGFQAQGDPLLGGKWVELLKEIAPNTLRVALLFNPQTAPPLEFYMHSIKPPRRPSQSRQLRNRFTIRRRSKALSPHKDAIRKVVSS